MLDLRIMHYTLATQSIVGIPAISTTWELLHMQTVQPHHRPVIQNLSFNTAKFQKILVHIKDRNTDLKKRTRRERIMTGGYCFCVTKIMVIRHN